MNYIKRCTTDNIAEGCWSAPSAPTDDDPDGYVLASGAFLVDIEGSSCSGSEGITIDWNGASSPNLDGDDRMTLIVYYDTNTKKPGYVEPYSAYSGSVSLYNSVFK